MPMPSAIGIAPRSSINGTILTKKTIKYFKNMSPLYQITFAIRHCNTKTYRQTSKLYYNKNVY